MVLHLTISLILSSVIHLVDFLDPLINCHLFVHLPVSLISRLTVAGHLLSQHSVWNALEFELRSCDSLSSFKSKPKTWLIKVSYDVVL